MLQRDGTTALTLKTNNEVQFSGYVLVNNISTPVNTDLAIRRSGTELIRLIQLSGDLLVNTINSNGDNDLVVQRDENEFFKCEVFTDTEANTYNLINIPPTARISAHHVYVGNVVK